MTSRNEYDPLEHIAESLARIADALETLASTVDDGVKQEERYDAESKTTKWVKVRRHNPLIRTDS